MSACQCADLAEADRPCLDCEANYRFPPRSATREEVAAFLKRAAERPPTEAEAVEAELGDMPW